MGKFIFRSFSVAASTLLGLTLYQANFAGHASGGTGKLSAGGGAVQSAMNKVGPASDRAISQITANLRSGLTLSELFLRRNGTRAQVEIQSTVSSLPSTLGGYLSRSGSNWLQSTAQKASQAAGNKPDIAAKKIPVVNGALNATKERIAAVGQSINGAASSF